MGLRTARFASLCSPTKKNSWFGTNFMQVVRNCAKCIEEQTDWTFAVVFVGFSCRLNTHSVGHAAHLFPRSLKVIFQHWNVVAEVVVDEAWWQQSLFGHLCCGRS